MEETYFEKYSNQDTGLPLCGGLIDVRGRWNKQYGVDFITPAAWEAMCVATHGVWTQHTLPQLFGEIALEINNKVLSIKGE